MTSAHRLAQMLTAALGPLLLVVLILNAAALTAAIILRHRPTPRPTIPTQTPVRTPKVSIHLPIHDEPPTMVIATLDALSRLDYPASEVIVIDNNTPDPATWQPVERHCASLGFRFAHHDAVIGAKAGALNIAAAMMDPAATHIAVVDSDYLVLPDFLTQAVAALADADYVQFPQRYHHPANAAPIAAELNDYFANFAATAGPAILLTGTLSVISAEWLHKVGGWPTAHLTEDAELGLRLIAAGARGIYIDRPAGHGRLPSDLKGLILQRDRWVAGNIQALFGALKTRPHTAILAQLLAWPAFAAIPLIALTTAALAPATPTWSRVVHLAAITILAEIAALFIQHFVRRIGTARSPGAALVKYALLIPASLAWLPVLWGQHLRFRRTPKFASASTALPASLLATGLWSALLALAYVQTAPLASAALIALALSVPAALAVARMLQTPEPRVVLEEAPQRAG